MQEIFIPGQKVWWNRSQVQRRLARVEAEVVSRVGVNQDKIKIKVKVFGSEFLKITIPERLEVIEPHHWPKPVAPSESENARVQAALVRLREKWTEND